MGRQNCNPTVIHSSIALLQERFRQLERAKEMRQQRQLLRLFSEADQVQPAKQFEAWRQYFHSELSVPPLQGSHFLHQNTQNKHTDFPKNQTLNSTNLWSKNAVMQIADSINEPDVDTSLHL